MKPVPGKLVIGFFLLILGVFMPSLIGAHHLNIFPLISKSVSTHDSGLLLLASSRLVFLNTIRAIPHYTGAFLIGDELRQTKRMSNLTVIIFPVLLIPLVYLFISLVYGFSYDFGGPAFLSILIIILIYISTKNIQAHTGKLLVIFLFLFGFRWLEMVPALTPIGFGHGEISLSIKTIAELLDAEDLFNFFGVTFASITMINALIISRLIVAHYNRMHFLQEKREKEDEIKQIKLEMVKSQSLKEMRHLVHDLKTPLTTIQGLCGVIEALTSSEKIRDYSQKISLSVERMSQIISEIIYEEAKRPIKTEDLISYIQSQVDYSQRIQVNFQNKIPGMRIPVNRIRFSRAIINLVDNALQAVDPLDTVMVTFQSNSSQLEVEVVDNGCGIKDHEMKKIWHPGFSGKKGSTGLGLNLVEEVIRSHGGQIKIWSTEGEGTRVSVKIPDLMEEVARGGTASAVDY